MKPETEAYIAHARVCVGRSRLMLTVSLDQDAARAAYLVCFHAAQAFIFEKTGKVAKTHNGVRSEFLRLTKDEPFDPILRSFLSQAYGYKSQADYFSEDGVVATAETAAAAVDTAERFLAQVSELLPPASRPGETT